MRPRPLVGVQVHFCELQCGHNSDGGNQRFLQSSQHGISSFRSRKPFQYGCDSADGTGMGFS